MLANVLLLLSAALLDASQTTFNGLSGQHLIVSAIHVNKFNFAVETVLTYVHFSYLR
jgi:hypothetical protein